MIRKQNAGVPPANRLERPTSSVFYPQADSLAIEVKTGRNKPTEAQAAFLKKIKENGGLAIVAYGIEDVEKAFKSLPGYSHEWHGPGHQERLL